MSSILPKPLVDLIDELAQLPGVGPRTAERYAYFLLRASSAQSLQLSKTLSKLHAGVVYCPKTFALMEAGQSVSPLYNDPKRNRRIVAVVADPFDIAALEKTDGYAGTYHVLGGLLSPIDGVGPDQLHIEELIDRIGKDKVEEVILATNASVEGESTALLIAQKIGKRKVKVTRLARGLPVGVDLEYADQITLTRALEGRQKI